MKVNVGIVGYGNLGKAVEKLAILDSQINLVAIFSRRNVSSEFKTQVLNVNKIEEFEGTIDVLILCGGSYSDIPQQTENLIKKFNIINSFDTHKNIASEVKKINTLARRNNTVALCSIGWDPGLFSVIRLLFSKISTDKVACCWGKGVSMGHSNALKQIVGVKHAKSYTIPKKNKKEIIHKRVCVIVKNGNKNKKEIIQQIKNNNLYFGDKNLKIKFIKEKCFLKKHNKIYHAGKVFTKFKMLNESFNLKLEVNMSSNPLFTAKIMIVYAKALKNIKNKLGAGAYTALDIPPAVLHPQGKFNAIESYC